MSTLTITLSGPPGCGKSLIAARIISEVHALAKYHVVFLDEGERYETGDPTNPDKIRIICKQEPEP